MIQFDDHVFQMGWNHQLDQVKSPNLFVPSNLQLTMKKLTSEKNHHFALSLWFSIPSNMFVLNVSDPFKVAVAETKPATPTPKLGTSDRAMTAQNWFPLLLLSWISCNHLCIFMIIRCLQYYYHVDRYYIYKYHIYNHEHVSTLTSSNICKPFSHTKKQKIQLNPLRFQHLPSVATWLCAAPLRKVGMEKWDPFLMKPNSLTNISPF